MPRRYLADTPDLKVANPQPGDIIYVPTQMYTDHGEDDCRGGKAIITRVRPDPGANGGDLAIYVKEVTKHVWYWSYLASHQDEWEAEYGEQWAKDDPDYG